MSCKTMAAAALMGAFATTTGCGREPLRSGPGGSAAPGEADASAAGVGGAQGVIGSGGAAGGGAAPTPAEWTELIAPPEIAGGAVTDAWAAGPDDIYFTASRLIDSPA